MDQIIIMDTISQKLIQTSHHEEHELHVRIDPHRRGASGLSDIILGGQDGLLAILHLGQAILRASQAGPGCGSALVPRLELLLPATIRHIPGARPERLAVSSRVLDRGGADGHPNRSAQGTRG